MSNELINQWKTQSYTFHHSDDLLDRLSRELNDMKRKIFLRNLRESLAALVVIIFFAYYIVSMDNLFNRVLYALGILWALSVVYIFWRKEQLNDPRLSLRILDFLSEQKEYYYHQWKLLKYAGIWYVLPPFVMVTVHLIKLDGFTGLMSWYYLLVILFSAFVFWINQWYANNKLKPMLSEIQALIDHYKDKKHEE